MKQLHEDPMIADIIEALQAIATKYGYTDVYASEMRPVDFSSQRCIESVAVYFEREGKSGI